MAGAARRLARARHAARHPAAQRPVAGRSSRRICRTSRWSRSSFRSFVTAAPIPTRGCCASAMASRASCARSATCCSSSCSSCCARASTRSSCRAPIRSRTTTRRSADFSVWYQPTADGRPTAMQLRRAPSTSRVRAEQLAQARDERFHRVAFLAASCRRGCRRPRARSATTGPMAATRVSLEPGPQLGFELALPREASVSRWTCALLVNAIASTRPAASSAMSSATRSSSAADAYTYGATQSASVPRCSKCSMSCRVLILRCRAASRRAAAALAIVRAVGDEPRGRRLRRHVLRRELELAQRALRLRAARQLRRARERGDELSVSSPRAARSASEALDAFAGVEHDEVRRLRDQSLDPRDDARLRPAQSWMPTSGQRSTLAPRRSSRPAKHVELPRLRHGDDATFERAIGCRRTACSSRHCVAASALSASTCGAGARHGSGRRSPSSAGI